MSDKEITSHKQILKSSGIVGGAQVIIIIINIVRTKIIAILLGPVGIGLMGLFQSTIDLIKTATGFGIGFSAVRDIAAAAGSNDDTAITKTILTLKRWVWATGIFGALVTIALSHVISKYFLKVEAYRTSIMLLSVTVLFAALSSGQLAILQGLRKVGKMALANIIGAALGLLFSVPLYYFFGLDGIVPTMILTALITLCVTTFHSNSVELRRLSYPLIESYHAGKSMIKLGIFTVISGLASTATLYIVRIFIVNRSGMSYVGEFQAAWNFSTIYLAIVLNAMATDYFPRLTAMKDNNLSIKKLVNEQTEIALIVAGPVIIFMLSFTDLIIKLLYSSKFTGSINILQWQIAGDLLKVITWPMGFIILAKGHGKYFVLSEVMWNISFLLIVYFGWDLLHLEITGIAFIFSYLICLGVVFGYARRTCNFWWTKVNLRHILLFLFLTAVSLLNAHLFSGAVHYIIRIVCVLIATLYSFKHFTLLFSIQEIIGKIRRKLKI